MHQNTLNLPLTSTIDWLHFLIRGRCLLVCFVLSEELRKLAVVD